MERLHWVQHRCRQLLAGDSGRGWYSTPNGLPNKSSLEAHTSPHRVGGKRRTVFARHGPHQQEYEAVCKSYKGNAIRTTKYSLLTFIPMNLFQQFHRSDFYLNTKHIQTHTQHIFFMEVVIIFKRTQCCTCRNVFLQAAFYCFTLMVHLTNLHVSNPSRF